MKHYLTNNEIRAIEEGQEFLVKADWVLLSDEELYAMLNPPKTEAQILAEKIAEAKTYLTSTDWVESYLIKHYTNLEVLEADSNKFVIEAKRNEARAFLKEQGL